MEAAVTLFLENPDAGTLSTAQQERAFERTNNTSTAAAAAAAAATTTTATSSTQAYNPLEDFPMSDNDNDHDEDDDFHQHRPVEPAYPHDPAYRAPIAPRREVLVGGSGADDFFMQEDEFNAAAMRGFGVFGTASRCMVVVSRLLIHGIVPISRQTPTQMRDPFQMDAQADEGIA